MEKKYKTAIDVHEGVLKIPAKVVSVYAKLLILDIGGLGIPGYMRVADWSLTYTVEFPMVVNRGDIVEVVILKDGQLSKEESIRYFSRWTNRKPYRCSRKLTLTENPWKNIEEKLQRGDVVTVQVMGKCPMNFYGVSKLFPELTFYGHYEEPGKELDRKGVRIGKYYECVVRRVSEEKRDLRVNVVREIESEYLEEAHKYGEKWNTPKCAVGKDD